MTAANTPTRRRVRTVPAVICAVLAMALAAAGPAAATPAIDVAGHHGPTAFQPDGAGTFAFFLTNVGDRPTDAGRDDNGTPSDYEDDTLADPITVAVALPAGVTTRLDNDFAPLFPGAAINIRQGNDVERTWDCSSGPDIFTAGQSQLRCELLPTSRFHGALHPGQSQRLYIYVQAGPGVSGALTAQATVSGGGAPTVTGAETAVVGPEADRFAILPESFEADAFDGAGQPERQAGAHPWRASVAFDVSLRSHLTPDFAGDLKPAEVALGGLRSATVDLPPGFVGNPTAVARCTSADLTNGDATDSEGSFTCPANSQVGTVDVTLESLGGLQDAPTHQHSAVYNLVPARGALAELGFAVAGTPVHIRASLDPVDHSIKTQVLAANEFLLPHHQRLTIWGVPGDPAHDGDRWNSNCRNPTPGTCLAGPGIMGYGNTFEGPVKPFLTLPSECGKSRTTVLSGVASWQNPKTFLEPLSSVPAQVQGCDKLIFTPAISTQPTATATDAPSGLDVELSLPQSDSTGALGTPPLKKATVVLPEGMTINPSSADGLQACTDAQLGLGTDAPVSCPDGAKIGSVVATSPAIEGPAGGDVYVRTQSSQDPESGEMFRLALVVRHEERGLLVKLPGSVRVNRQTGRIVTEFDNNPQLPVSSIRLRLKGGPRAPLATPADCGEKTVETELSSWGGQVSKSSQKLSFDCPGTGPLNPLFKAGTLDSTAGAFSPFVLRLDRSDRQRFMNNLRFELPTGVLAKLKGAVGQQVGTVKVAAGVGGSPFWLPGRVFLEGPYDGAPFSLRVVVPAKAGPFDLGEVVVRQRLFVDPTDAHVTVVSDPLPTIVGGVPVRLRSVAVEMDRPGFTLNPTSCAAKAIRGTVGTTDGGSVPITTHFQASDCRALALKPKLKLGLMGRKQLTDGRHPGLKATLTQGAGQAGLRKVAVKLPLSLALDPDNADGLCEHVESIKPEPNCPASSIVGRAKAWTPLLDKPLEGPVYFAKNVRVDKKTGRQIRTLPKLVIPLRGEVALNLIGNSDTTKDGRLVNTFATVPDAPVSKFELSLKGGSKGILVVNGKACNRSRIAAVEIDGHNGKTADHKPKLTAPCGKAKKAKRKRH